MPVVGERYQLVITKAVREALGVRPGDRAVESVEDGRLVVTFLPAPHRRSLRGCLAGPGGPVDFARLRDEGTLANELAAEHGPDRIGRSPEP
ncbi:MAG TPA: AbrB/MazE/SpoVT family DNA-binding domain-containing protein [Candidatus Binatia bacterium]|nr:AbrB/MazE/SpoVT family DNA-binding domain-containing protein [Candidatus Binatia bacterium]